MQLRIWPHCEVVKDAGAVQGAQRRCRFGLAITSAPAIRPLHRGRERHRQAAARPATKATCTSTTSRSTAMSPTSTRTPANPTAGASCAGRGVQVGDAGAHLDRMPAVRAGADHGDRLADPAVPGGAGGDPGRAGLPAAASGTCRATRQRQGGRLHLFMQTEPGVRTNGEEAGRAGIAACQAPAPADAATTEPAMESAP